jgi:hypothetical protein
MSDLHFYRGRDNSLLSEYFHKSYCVSKLTGKPKKWLKFNGSIYKLEK